MPAVLVTGPTVAQNSPFLPWRWPLSSPVLIVPTRGGMARLSWPGWLVTYKDGLPVLKTITHPSTKCYEEAKAKGEVLGWGLKANTVVVVVGRSKYLQKRFSEVFQVIQYLNVYCIIYHYRTTKIQQLKNWG